MFSWYCLCCLYFVNQIALKETFIRSFLPLNAVQASLKSMDCADLILGVRT